MPSTARASTLDSPRVRSVLDRLFMAAANDDDIVPQWPDGSSRATATAQQHADAMADAYLPISAAGGALLYALARASRPDTIVEFGMSLGISTLHLAAAVADNGHGRVLTTELSTSKISAARASLAAAGLAAHVTILAGDARQTLADVPGPVGLVLLDGWKDLCLPVLRLLEPRLAPGALVVADDTSFSSMADYLAYVRAPGSGYVSVAFPVEDEMEMSCWAGVAPAI